MRLPDSEVIAVTGAGLITCLGVGCEANWRRIVEGTSGLGPIHRFDTEGYPVKTGGEVPPSDAMEPAGAMEISALEQACLEAMEPTRLSAATEVSSLRRALVIGSSLAGSSTGEAFFQGYLNRGPLNADYSVLEGYYVERSLERLSRKLGIAGPSILVSNACAAGGSSIARGASLIRRGRADWVLCAGYDPLSLFTFAGFGSLMALSSTTIRPFDRERDGMLLGDGYAAIVLERADPARQRSQRPLAVLAGYGESTDAHHLTHPHPEGGGAVLAMRRALALAELSPADIDYVNCHGTATRPNDSSENKALRTVFGERLATLPASSSKPFFGHTLGGAGTVEAVVTLLALERQYLPPTLNLNELDPGLSPMDLVPGGRAAFLRNAMSNNFGFGGSNVSLIFTRGEGS